MPVINKSRRRRELVMLGAFSGVLALLLFFGYGMGRFSAAYNFENLIRLHVIANSDSPQDQDLKLLVRDGLIPYIQDLTANCKSAQEVEAAVAAAQAVLSAKAADIVAAHGYDYPVRVEMGIFDFTRKQTLGITLPAGRYKALKVTIGEGAGRNWWCILFPSLCFGADSVTVSTDRPLEKPAVDAGSPIQWRWRLFKSLNPAARQ